MEGITLITGAAASVSALACAEIVVAKASSAMASSVAVVSASRAGDDRVERRGDDRQHRRETWVGDGGHLRDALADPVQGDRRLQLRLRSGHRRVDRSGGGPGAAGEAQCQSGGHDEAAGHAAPPATVTGTAAGSVGTVTRLRRNSDVIGVEVT